VGLKVHALPRTQFLAGFARIDSAIAAVAGHAATTIVAWRRQNDTPITIGGNVARAAGNVLPRIFGAAYEDTRGERASGGGK
jgi:hypothetical protein